MAVDAAADGRRLAYRPDIEGLRAVAIVLVVAAHAGIPGLQGGFVGVDVFFVLSGFLITGLLASEAQATGGIALAAFYARRLRRLLPGLLAMLVVSGLAAALLLAPLEQREQAATAAAAATWTSNLLLTVVGVGYFEPAAESNWFLHTWSLGVEEQFYLAWPALVLVLLQGRREGAARRLALGLAAIAVGGLLLEAWATVAYPRFAFYQVPARAWQFALGALAWQGTRTASAFDRRAPVLGALGLVLIVAAAMVLDAARHPYPGLAALLPSVGAALVLAAGARRSDAGPGRWLAFAPMPYLGRISYAWYLWHWPVLLGLAAIVDTPTAPAIAAGVALSLGLAMASRRWIEAPFRQRGAALRHPGRTLAVSVLAMAIAAGGALAWRSASLRWMQTPGQAPFRAADNDVPKIYQLGCDTPPQDASVRPCVFARAHATRTAVLWGDSIAAQWFPAAADTFARAGWRLVLITKSACPVVAAPVFARRLGREDVECARWRKDAAAWIRQQRPDVLVLGSSDAYPLSTTQWQGGTGLVLDAVAPATGRVFVLAATPSLPYSGTACLARRAWQGPASRLECVAPASDERAPVRLALQRAIAGRANVALVDLDDAVCPGGQCAARRDGVVVFRDNSHVTARFAASLGPEFERRLRAQGWDPEAASTPR